MPQRQLIEHALQRFLQVKGQASARRVEKAVGAQGRTAGLLGYIFADLMSGPIVTLKIP